MHKKIQTLIIVAIVVIIGIFVYHSKPFSQKNKLDKEVAKLNNLIVGSHDCDTVITEAKSFVAKSKDAVEIWNFLGVCQFDTGKFTDAEASFEKVLSLEPNHVGAKTYLERLKTISSQVSTGGISVVSSGSTLSQADFEKVLGIQLKGGLTFSNAYTETATIPLYAVGTYTSSKNLADTSSYIESELKKINPTVNLSKLPEGNVLAQVSATEQKIFFIKKGSPVQMQVKYLKLK